MADGTPMTPKELMKAELEDYTFTSQDTRVHGLENYTFTSQDTQQTALLSSSVSLSVISEHCPQDKHTNSRSFYEVMDLTVVKDEHLQTEAFDTDTEERSLVPRPVSQTNTLYEIVDSTVGSDENLPSGSFQTDTVSSPTSTTASEPTVNVGSLPVVESHVQFAVKSEPPSYRIPQENNVRITPSNDFLFETKSVTSSVETDPVASVLKSEQTEVDIDYAVKSGQPSPEILQENNFEGITLSNYFLFETKSAVSSFETVPVASVLKSEQTEDGIHFAMKSDPQSPEILQENNFEGITLSNYFLFETKSAVSSFETVSVASVVKSEQTEVDIDYAMKSDPSSPGLLQENSFGITPSAELLLETNNMTSSFESVPVASVVKQEHTQDDILQESNSFVTPWSSRLDLKQDATTLASESDMLPTDPSPISSNLVFTCGTGTMDEANADVFISPESVSFRQQYSVRPCYVKLERLTHDQIQKIQEKQQPVVEYKGVKRTIKQHTKSKFHRSLSDESKQGDPGILSLKSNSSVNLRKKRHTKAKERSNSPVNLRKNRHTKAKERSNSPVNVRKKRHTKAKERIACEICGVLMQRSWKKRHMTQHDTNTARPFVCRFCGWATTTINAIRQHERLHTLEKPFQCSVCGQSFAQKSALTQHLRVHTGEKPYKCDKCGKSFAQRNNFLVHRNRHLGYRPFECQECDKKYYELTQLKNHRRKHTGAMPYRCEFCGKAYGCSQSLTYHRRTHTGERPYACDLCGDSFADPKSFSKHKEEHAVKAGEKPPRQPKYKCDECGKTYSRRSLLETHISRHRGEKPYGCKNCGEKFAASRDLNKHIRTLICMKD